MQDDFERMLRVIFLLVAVAAVTAGALYYSLRAAGLLSLIG